MMRLLIDAGNTRIKLALVDGEDWSPIENLPSQPACDLTPRLADCVDSMTTTLRNAPQVWVSNVAGDEVAQHIHAACAARHWLPQFIVARASQCGVHNGYANPAQLGSDRWASLIAAWHQTGGACLVVNCGTATTIDALSARGEFIGGLILPGVELMQHSLIAATAQLHPRGNTKAATDFSVGAGLRPAPTLNQQGGIGEYASFPRNTADALFSGAIQASCGAIQRQYALLDDACPEHSRRDSAPVVLSGGAAELLRSHLNLPLRMVDNLVLQGLLLIAQEAGTS